MNSSPKKKFELLLDDEYIVVANKPAKMLVVPSPKKKRNMTSLLSEQLGQTVYPCHRLDEETSGLIIFAKSVEIQQQVMKQFKDKTVFKMYIAFVQGAFKRKALIRSEVKAIGKRAKEAVTKFITVEKFEQFSVVRAIPLTGRSNQIRIHCAQQDHPIIGDRKYSVAKDWPLKFKRTCLHSFKLEFNHPISGDLLNFVQPMPDDMRDFLNKLKSTCL